MSDLTLVFEMVDKLGEGSFGSVWRAIDKRNMKIVAIKFLKDHITSREQCMNMIEIKSLVNLGRHPNIVHLKEVFMENNNAYLIFENMECSLLHLMNRRCPRVFQEKEVRHYMFQLLMGLAHMHQQGYVHRDLKPENVLVDFDGLHVKIADLGMAIKVSKSSPTGVAEYVASRWYRAPEVLLGLPHGAAMDMWAMGCIMAELFTFQPLFLGSNSADQIDKICGVIGRPSLKMWEEGVRHADQLGFEFPGDEHACGVRRWRVSKVVPGASEEAIRLIDWLCSWDPSKRPTAMKALQHPFFHTTK
ncbi:hypothetical protein Syun_007660 [Stephania yunnanensis]|uniref:Protein kinase domain-containing protein n=1 Tax=Stephania yunnanensis TaxID=152371 RepID=A0AAP0Q0G6_9MAGN